MTILPKKKHQDSKRNEQDHENELRNRTRTRNVRENRSRTSQPTDDLLSIADPSSNNILGTPSIYNDLDNRDPQEVISLPHKRSRHRQGSNFLSTSIEEGREDDEEENEENDGYNSSDEHGPARVVPQEKVAVNETQQEQEEEFERELHEKKGFDIKQMATDGACMFRAVADQVYGDQEMHSVVRRHCMDYMLKNRDFFSPYVTEDFSCYIRRKRNEHAHGNHIEMQALSEMYNRPIEVYQYSCEPINTFHSRSYYHDDNAPIRLSYHGNVHYNSISDPYNPTVGVGLGLAGYKPGMTNENINKALKESEGHLLENEMLKDKLKATDWEATDEQLAELAAKESYLQWLKDTQNNSNSGASSSTSSSTQTRKSPPREGHSRKSPPRDNRRSPPYDSRKSPTYESRKSPQEAHKSSPYRKSPKNKSPPRDDKNTNKSLKTFNSDNDSSEKHLNEQDKNPLTSASSATTDWSYALGYDLEFENDPVLAAVLAQSQQEYLDSLTQNKDSQQTTEQDKN